MNPVRLDALLRESRQTGTAAPDREAGPDADQPPALLAGEALTSGRSPAPLRAGSPHEFAERLLARLPRVRFVIPGSFPGLRPVLLAGVLGLLAAAGIGRFRHHLPGTGGLSGAESRDFPSGGRSLGGADPISGPGMEARPPAPEGSAHSNRESRKIAGPPPLTLFQAGLAEPAPPAAPDPVPSRPASSGLSPEMLPAPAPALPPEGGLDQPQNGRTVPAAARSVSPSRTGFPVSGPPSA